MRSTQRRRAPRPASLAVTVLSDSLAPQTAISRVQRVWADVAGELIAAQCEPTSERSGVVTVTCASAVWAQELDLLSADLIERLNAELQAPLVTALRCQPGQARKWPEARR
jgi:predicted nucleic acid-binding Zn ribbon protein